MRVAALVGRVQQLLLLTGPLAPVAALGRHGPPDELAGVVIDDDAPLLARDVDAMAQRVELADHRRRPDRLKPLVAIVRDVVRGEQREGSVHDRAPEQRVQPLVLALGAALKRRDLLLVALDDLCDGRRGGDPCVGQRAAAVDLGLELARPLLGVGLGIEALAARRDALAADLRHPSTAIFPDVRHVSPPDANQGGPPSCVGRGRHGMKDNPGSWMDAAFADDRSNITVCVSRRLPSEVVRAPFSWHCQLQMGGES